MSQETSNSRETTTLAGGCFWCLEAVYDELKGVEDVKSGYAGGQTDQPTYHEVCSGTTGHAEVVQVSFDPAVISFEDILDVFFTIHDPTTLNRQGNDVGTQYRSAIYYHTSQQREVAQRKIQALEAEKLWHDPIVTEVEPIARFFPAEDYHQEYFVNNPFQPYCMAVVNPKVQKARKAFREKLKKS
jgi:peptide-methionine (S)-S-oxide reductase